MSLYYFHVEEGDAAHAPLAIDFPDVEAARRQAVAWFTALSRDLADNVGWQMRVTDAAGHHSFSLEFASMDTMAEAARNCRSLAEQAFVDFARPHKVTVREV